MPNPLTEEDRERIDSMLARIKDTRADIARARLAGIDMSEEEAALNTLESQLGAVKQAYFPTGSKPRAR